MSWIGIRQRRGRLAVCLLAVTVLLLGGGIAWAAVPESSAVITGCVDTRYGTGVLRIVAADKPCLRHESRITWNEEGRPGDPGPAGPEGPPGVAGATGNTGASAYEIWLAAGNVGTEADFLASLRGPSGADGGGVAEVRSVTVTSPVASAAYYDRQCTSHNALGMCIYTDVYVPETYARTVTALVTCPDGMRAQSGGGSVQSSELTPALRENRFATGSGGRSTTAADATAWTVTYSDTATQVRSQWRVTADVLCVAG